MNRFNKRYFALHHVCSAIFDTLSILVEHQTTFTKDTPAGLRKQLKAQLHMVFSDDMIADTVDYYYGQSELHESSYMDVYNALEGYRSEADKYAFAIAKDNEFTLPEIFKAACAYSTVHFLKGHYENIVDHLVDVEGIFNGELPNPSGKDNVAAMVATAIYRAPHTCLDDILSFTTPFTAEINLIDDQFEDAKIALTAGGDEPDGFIIDETAVFDDGAIAVLQLHQPKGGDIAQGDISFYTAKHNGELFEQTKITLEIDEGYAATRKVNGIEKTYIIEMHGL